MKRTLAALAALPLLALTACGGDEKPQAAATVTVTAESTPSESATPTSTEPRKFGEAEACAQMHMDLALIEAVVLPGVGKDPDLDALEASMSSAGVISDVAERLSDPESDLGVYATILGAKYAAMLEDPSEDNMGLSAGALKKVQGICR